MGRLITSKQLCSVCNSAYAVGTEPPLLLAEATSGQSQVKQMVGRCACLEHIQDVGVCCVQPRQPALQHGFLAGVDDDLRDSAREHMPVFPELDILAPCEYHRLCVSLPRLGDLHGVDE